MKTAPLPAYKELPLSPQSTPALYQEYAFILMTGIKKLEYFHSEFHQIRPLRKKHPFPMVEIHSTAAMRLGISDGDWVITACYPFFKDL